jgi:ABC-type nitrate/sulfonate/bicarbonate transport system substrate-binding protein
MAVLPSVTVALDWRANTNHTGLIVAQHRGFFADAGIAVRVLPAGRDRSVVDLVVSGEADLAYAFAGTVILSRAEGAPLISVAAVTPRNPSSIAALRRSGIARPADFAGKRYASYGHPALERAIICQMMADDGVADADFALEQVRFAGLDELVRGDFDLLWVYDAVEGVEAAAREIDLVLFHPQEFGVPEYEAPVIFASAGRLQDAARRDAIARALDGVARGYTLAAGDPDGVVADIDAMAPTIGGWLFTDAAVTRASQRMQSQLYLSGPGSRWGMHAPDHWRAFSRFLHEQGVLAADLPAEQLFTNDLLTAAS